VDTYILFQEETNLILY